MNKKLKKIIMDFSKNLKYCRYLKGIVITFLLISFISPEQALILKDTSVRSWSGNGFFKWREAEPFAYVKPKEKYQIIDKYGDFYEVRILDGKHKNRSGYVWIERAKKLNGNVYIITGDGVNFRETPWKGNNIMGCLKPGTKVKFLSVATTWVKISGGTESEAYFKCGWVCVYTKKVMIID